jgi:hypothetical protein
MHAKEPAVLGPPSRFVPPASTFEGYYRATRSLYRVFLLSPLIYILVGGAIKRFVMLPQGGFVDFAPAEYNLILAAMTLISLLLVAVASFVLPRVRPLSALVAHSASLPDLGAALSREQMLKMQMVQAPAIFGLVLFLLNGNLWHLILFSLLTALAQILVRVDWPRWEAARNEFEASHPQAGKATGA